jgi:hypothetical protein
MCFLSLQGALETKQSEKKNNPKHTKKLQKYFIYLDFSFGID